MKCRCGLVGWRFRWGGKVIVTQDSRQRAAEGDYRRARGAVPYREGDPMPEDIIARNRGHDV